MKVQYIDEGGKLVEVTGLFGMKPEDRVGRQKVFHTNIIQVNNSGRCTPLEKGKRAIFVVLEDSKVRVGSLGTEFFLGVRIDELSEMKTSLVCGCGLQELSETELRYHGVRDFVDRIRKEGYLPQCHEVPRVLLDITKCQKRF